MPTTTLDTRKPIEDLTAADLEAFPVWEFADDEEGTEEQDETWVRPLAATSVPTGGDSLSVAAALRLANGLVYPGALFCDTHAGLHVSGVAILTTQGRVLFTPGDTKPEVRRALKRFGLSAAQVFPIQYSTRVPVGDGPGHGTGAFAIDAV
jgi:hypothetical protein